MKNLIDKIFGSNKTVDELYSLLKNKDAVQNINVHGLSGSAKAFLIASIFHREKMLSCVVLPDKETAAYFYDDLINLAGDKYVLFFHLHIKDR